MLKISAETGRILFIWGMQGAICEHLWVCQHSCSQHR